MSGYGFIKESNTRQVLQKHIVSNETTSFSGGKQVETSCDNHGHNLGLPE